VLFRSQAALTGHMVLSTLHTNDTVSTIARLTDMGVERFKIAPGLIAITAQRLVRRLCPDCREEIPPEQASPTAQGLLSRHGLPPRYFTPKGCEKCEFSGFRGRLSILELLEVGAALKERIMAGDEASALRQHALDHGMLHTMMADAAWHLSQGDVGFEELAPYLQLDEKSGSSPKPQPAQAPAAPAQAPAAPVQPQAAETGGQARLLVVDDEVANRFIARKLLEPQGYRITEAVDGLQALECLTKEEPDLVLLDINMPNLDGYGVLKALRQTLGMTSLPVIVLTTLTDEKSQEDAFAAGADDYVNKPFKPAILTARIKAALKRKTLSPAA
jgi:CheY-like chemotaxis protein